MTFQEEASCRRDILKIVCSSPKGAKWRKITLIPTGQAYFAEMLTDTQAFHKAIPFEEMTLWAEDVVGKYRQIALFCKEETVTYLFSKNKFKRLSHAEENKEQSAQHKKKYILDEGNDIPAFVDLGVFTKDFKVVRSMYDKFRQVNRFIETVDDLFKDSVPKKLTVADFGCVKSYLTFFLYHYLTNVRKIDAEIVGYDLKEDVVAKCNDIAVKYGYGKLHFVAADVARGEFSMKPDMVVSLHACDTATDYAIHFAVTSGAKYLLSVPCCQHEVNLSIRNGGEMDFLLRYGLIKERTSALITDSIRAMLLEDCGYKVDVLEFIDFSHSPKNVMIRAIKRGRKKHNAEEIRRLMQKYGFSHTLFDLLQRDGLI